MVARKKLSRKGEKNKISRKGEKNKMSRKGEKNKMYRKGEKNKMSRKGEKNKMYKNRPKSRKKKRPLNEFFREMLRAKTENKSSFIYKNTKYIGYKHDKLGMIYKKEK